MYRLEDFLGLAPSSVRSAEEEMISDTLKDGDTEKLARMEIVNRYQQQVAQRVLAACLLWGILAVGLVLFLAATTWLVASLFFEDWLARHIGLFENLKTFGSLYVGFLAGRADRLFGIKPSSDSPPELAINGGASSRID